MPGSNLSPSVGDRNLLFGILALQMDFISRDALIQGMNRWVLQKSSSLGQILVDQGALSSARCAMLEPLVQEHINSHGSDAQQSLAALSTVDSVRDQLRQIADSDVQASLSHVPGPQSTVDDDPYATREPSVGTLTSAGTRFRILRPHARGGLGEVFLARDEELPREVALKQIQDRFADNPDSRSRFLLEAEITGGLEHPGIVPVYGLGQYADGRPFYAMRFIRGDSLKEAIERFHRDEGPEREPGERTLALRKLLARFLDVCNAMAYAHSRGILHRDLKPGNIMLGPYGETLVVDWGLAKPMSQPEAAPAASEQRLRPSGAHASTHTQIGSAVGTPAFMSPEQAAGQLDQLGPASDVYSLGATLYCLLTGQAPFHPSSDLGPLLQKVQAGDFPRPRQIKPGLHPGLEAICVKAMARAPAERYPSPRGLAEDLEQWLADKPVSAYAEPWTVPLQRWVRQHRGLFGGLIAVVVVLVTGICTTSLGLVRAQTERDHAQKAELQAQKDRDLAVAARDQAETAERKAERARQEKSRLLASSYVDAARLARQRGAWRTALADIDQALAEGYADSAALRLEKVQAWCAVHDIPHAVQELAQLAGRTDVGDLQGRVLLWQADLSLLKSWHSEQALKQVRAALQTRQLTPAEEAYARGLLAKTSPEAVGYFQQAIQADPFHPRANSMMALLLTLLGQHQEARERIMVAELIFPEDPTFRVIHAVLAALQDRMPEANDQLNEARKQLGVKHLATAQALVEVAHHAHGMGAAFDDPDLSPMNLMMRMLPAISKLQNALNDPEADLFLPVPPVLDEAMRGLPVNLSLVELLSLNTDRLIEDLARAVTIHPDGMLYLMRGLLLSAKDSGESWTAAEEAFRGAVDTPSPIPVHRPALYLAASAEWVLVREHKAPEEVRQRCLQNMRQLLALGGLQADQYYNVAVFAMTFKEMDLARWILSEGARLFPQDARFLPQQAMAKMIDQDFANAIKMIDQVLKRTLSAKDAEQWQKKRATAVTTLQKQAEAVRPPKATPPASRTSPENSKASPEASAPGASTRGVYARP